MTGRYWGSDFEWATHAPIAEAAGIDRTEVAWRLFDTYLKQIFEDGFFHADPHPANIMVSGTQIALLDYGMVGFLSQQMREDMGDLLVSVITQNTAIEGGGVALENTDTDLAWVEITDNTLRNVVLPPFKAAVDAGVAFAVILVFMQLGFRSAMLESALRYHERLRYDLVLVSPSTVFIGLTYPFPKRRLYQALALDSVASVSPAPTAARRALCSLPLTRPRAGSRPRWPPAG